MAQARGDALEWALALAKSPAERVDLRQRPLPDGMQRLLQIAGDGAPGSVAELAAQTGEAPADIVEAARFYAREVLFHQGADAYRVLGVAHNAPQDTVRSHHRLLQQWLHPDRHTSDWDAIFAARVNGAWNLLRTPDRRSAYDDANPPRRYEPRPGNPASLSAFRAEIPIEAPAPDRWRRRAPVLMLGAVCAALGVVAVRDMQRTPGTNELHASTSAAPVVDALPALKAPAVVRTPKTPKSRVAVSPATRGMPRAAHPDTTPAPVARVALAPVTQVASAPPARPPLASQTRPPVPAVAAVALPRNPVPRSRPLADVALRAAAPAPATPVRAAAAAAPVARAAVIAAAPVLAQQLIPVVVSTQRVQQAQQVGDRLITFMSAPNAASPPIWSSPRAQSAAGQLRNDLHDDGNLKISDVHWKVGESVGDMRADLKYEDGRKGRLAAELVWREQRWLVSGLSIERDL